MFKVYKIKNIVNGKEYIGVTERSLKDRFDAHWYRRYSNDSAMAMAFKKYGRDNFVIELVEAADSKKEMFQLERFYINKFNTFNNGYNLTLGGEGTPTVPYSDEEIIEEYLLLKSSEKVGKKLSIGSNTVLRVLRANNIELFGSGYESTLRLDSKEVADKYRELKTIKSTATFYGVKDKTIKDKLLKEKVPLYSYGYTKEDEKEIADYYINSFKSMTQLEEELGVSRKVISRILKANKVQINPNRNRTRPVLMLMDDDEFIFESRSECARFILSEGLTKTKTLKTIRNGIDYSFKNNTPYYNMSFKDLKI